MFDELPEEDIASVRTLIKEIKENWNLFRENIEALQALSVKRCNFAKEKEHTEKSICCTYLIIMSDATGGTKYALLGAVA